MKLLLRRSVVLFGAAFLLAVIFFFSGALLLPDASGNQAGPRRIYVLSNGFHSDIAVPVSAAEALGFQLDDYPVPPDAVRFFAIGWGSITAYTSLRAVSDLTPYIIAKAAAFDTTVMHVLPTAMLQPTDSVYAVDLSEAQYTQLIAQIAADFADLTPIADLSQGFGDRFYPAKGRFSPWRTCNSWTGRHLRSIGVPIGFWTPSAWSLEYGLDRLPKPER